MKKNKVIVILIVFISLLFSCQTVGDLQSMEYTKKAFALIDENGSGDWNEDITEDIVKKAEDFLDIIFPESYRAFLLKYGCGGIEGLEIYGICDSDFINSAIPDGIWLTSKVRTEIGINNSLIIIADSMEGYYVLDTSRMNSQGECPVIDWNAGLDSINNAGIMANSFGEFLFKELLIYLDE